MEEKFLSVYKECIDRWGIDSQVNMCIEEMSELTKALCKYRRYGNDASVIENIKEEIADVLNMVEQIQYYFVSDDIKEIEKIKDKKIERLKKEFE